jgi:reactive chlorine resistance protein C
LPVRIRDDRHPCCGMGEAMSPPASLPHENCENEMNTTTATTSSLKETREFARQLATVTDKLAEQVEAAGRHSIRYGLVLVLAWIGAMKFTAYEAEGISGFVSNSPLMSWAYQVFGQRQFSAILGVAETLTATLIAMRPFSAKLSAVGSALAIGTFLTTLTFLFSTPGVIESSLGFPALSAVPGQFLIKDVVLLGAAIWTAGEALRAVRREGK